MQRVAKVRKVLDLEIPSCGTCPFHEALGIEVETNHGDKYELGHFCLHKSRRGYIARLSDMNNMRSLAQYLRGLYGRAFPPDCPLEDKEIVEIERGGRKIQV